MRRVTSYGIAVLVITISIFAGYLQFANASWQQVLTGETAGTDESAKLPDPTDQELPYKWRSLAWRDSNGDISPDGLINALSQRDQYLAANAHTHGLGNDGTARINWVQRGPNNVGGRTRSLIVDPDNPLIIWAGAVSGGI